MTLLNCSIIVFYPFWNWCMGFTSSSSSCGDVDFHRIDVKCSEYEFYYFRLFLFWGLYCRSRFQSFVVAVTACEMAIALAIVVSMYRKRHSLDVNELRSLHE